MRNSNEKSLEGFVDYHVNEPQFIINIFIITMDN